MFQLLLAVFIGGGTGSVARWLLSMRFNPLHQQIPFGTLAANLTGAFIIGLGQQDDPHRSGVEIIDHHRLLRRADNVLNLLGGSGVPVTGWPRRLGAAERRGQSAGLANDDRARILVSFCN